MTRSPVFTTATTNTVTATATTTTTIATPGRGRPGCASVPGAAPPPLLPPLEPAVLLLTRLPCLVLAPDADKDGEPCRSLGLQHAGGETTQPVSRPALPASAVLRPAVAGAAGANVLRAQLEMADSLIFRYIKQIGCPGMSCSFVTLRGDASRRRTKTAKLMCRLHLVPPHHLGWRCPWRYAVGHNTETTFCRSVQPLRSTASPPRPS
ncbi:hypothetical protein E2C01_017438 [Portunus trituberculatus]|uniref:Uncharacterized protein n=1 Tax=Portunus trituberculatus TaxID=210409 RepID=A0A5B7DTT2_PORTR|nr:hypothetical protein [Portunus trituberculatus]